MDNDELKKIWHRMDARLENLEKELVRERREVGRDHARSRTRWVRLVLWYEIAFGTVAALLAGSYLAEVFFEPRFAIPSAMLHVGVLLILGSAIWQLVALSSLDYGRSVLEIQRRLTGLQRARARSNRWLLLSSPLLWASLVVAVPHGFLGLDVYRLFGMPWVLANFAFGATVLGLSIWACHRFPGWFERSPMLRALGDDITGQRLVDATGFLDELAGFAADESR